MSEYGEYLWKVTNLLNDAVVILQGLVEEMQEGERDGGFAGASVYFRAVYMSASAIHLVNEMMLFHTGKLEQLDERLALLERHAASPDAERGIRPKD